MLIRFFAAAAASTGVEAQRLDGPINLAELSELLIEQYPDSRSPSAPALSTLMTRCSFLVNEVAQRNLTAPLHKDDVVDVLPPFAGG